MEQSIKILKYPAVNASFTKNIGTNVFLKNISISQCQGIPTIRIGITPDGQEILQDTVISNFVNNESDQYFQVGGVVYFTFSGTVGFVNFRVEIIEDYM